MKKILLLGGSFAQIPAIKEAKRRGLYTILCDYLENNPGKEFADDYYNASTTNPELILRIAKEHHIDYVLAYASDPAAYTAAYVADQLGLPGSSPKSVDILSTKHKFRQFQKKHGFLTPRNVLISELGNIPANINIPFPVIVKPVDSSDTKGTHKVSDRLLIPEAVENAMQFSRSGNVIIEEYIDSETAEVHGDAFFLNGEMVFCMLGDRLCHSISQPLKPSSDSYPSRIPNTQMARIEQQVEQHVKKTGFSNGAVNIEARINKKGEVYIMEIGPRSGGTFTPEVIYHACGFNMLDATFDYLQGKKIDIETHPVTPSIYIALHTNKSGMLVDVDLHPSFKPYLEELHLYRQPGDSVQSYDKPNSTIGILLLKFHSFEELDRVSEQLYTKVQDSIIVNE